jgi:xanthine dehydrogenase molybdopterin-binding subunit B
MTVGTNARAADGTPLAIVHRDISPQNLFVLYGGVTKVVDFGPWLRRFIAQIRRNWFVPYAAMSLRGHVVLAFKVHRDGSVELFSGAQDIGTGFRTAMAMVTAEELGLRAADITARVGDTSFPDGPASGGSNTTNSVAPVVRLAAHDARTKVLALAAPLLKAKPDELDAADGKIFVAGQPSRSITFKQAAAMDKLYAPLVQLLEGTVRTPDQFTSEQLSQFLGHGNIFRRFDTAPNRHQNRRLRQVYRLFGLSEKFQRLAANLLGL